MTFRPHGPANTRQVKNAMGTGLVEGCVTTINSGNNKQFDISEGTLRFLDNTTDPLKPIFAERFFPGEEGIDIVSTNDGTHVVIDDTLTVITETAAGFDGPSQNRNRVELAFVFHIGDNPIDLIIPTYSNIGINTEFTAVDLMKAVGRIRLGGLRISANGANMMLDRSLGQEYSPYFENFSNDNEDPSTLPLDVEIAFSFTPGWSDTAGGITFGAFTQNISPAVFDDLTGGAIEPNGIVNNNSAQIMRIFEINRGFSVRYGTVVYISIAAAVDALLVDPFVATTVFEDTAFRGFLVVRGGATDISLSTDALFFDPMSNFVKQGLD